MASAKLNYIPRKASPSPAEVQKQEKAKLKIEILRKHIQEKLKDPKMTKKAAHIISDLLSQKK